MTEATSHSDKQLPAPCVHHWMIVLQNMIDHGTCKLCGAQKDFPAPRWTDSMLPSSRREK